jgi:hypothetical protein
VYRDAHRVLQRRWNRNRDGYQLSTAKQARQKTIKNGGNFTMALNAKKLGILILLVMLITTVAYKTVTHLMIQERQAAWGINTPEAILSDARDAMYRLKSDKEELPEEEEYLNKLLTDGPYSPTDAGFTQEDLDGFKKVYEMNVSKAKSNVTNLKRDIAEYETSIKEYEAKLKGNKKAMEEFREMQREYSGS